MDWPYFGKMKTLEWQQESTTGWLIPSDSPSDLRRFFYFCDLLILHIPLYRFFKGKGGLDVIDDRERDLGVASIFFLLFVN
jgi:hypothetical protein